MDKFGQEKYNLNRSDLSSYIASFFCHIIILLALILVIKQPLPKPLDNKFNVLLFYQPKTQAPEQKKTTSLYAQEKSSGAANFSAGKEIDAVKEGLKKGVSIGEKEVMREKSAVRSQQSGVRTGKNSEGLKMAKDEIKSREMVREDKNELNSAETENYKNTEGLGRENSEEKAGADFGANGKPGFSPRNIDKELLAKYAGPDDKDGLGGEDEDGEGGIDKYSGAGKVVDLNTSDLKFLSYFKHLKDLIESVWIYPREAKERGIEGRLVIRFTIKENGELGPVEVVNSSGYRFLDSAAVKALNDASPFPELPKRWKKKEITIAGNFIYYLYRGSIFY